MHADSSLCNVPAYASQSLTRGLDITQRRHPRKHQVCEGLAQRHAGHGLGIDQALGRGKSRQTEEIR